jgi:uncharacterized MAPEG superfamily protein
MNLVHAIIGLALIQFQVFGVLVGKARGTYGVKAPAVTGHEVFERYFRVQQNTLELLVVLIPALLLFAHYDSPVWAAALGSVYLVGRVLYAVAYIRNPVGRGLGFALSMLPTAIMLIGGTVGAIRTSL